MTQSFGSVFRRDAVVAVALGWNFFGPLLSGMIRAMRPFTPAELDTVEQFLHAVAAATCWSGCGQASS